MSILSSLRSVASTLVAMLHTRLDLLSVELEEELLRYSSYFIYTVIALFCGGVAVLLLIALILVLFWDEHRIAALASLIGFFGATALLIAAWIKKQIASKPRLLEHSIAELRKDSDLLFASASSNEEESAQ